MKKLIKEKTIYFYDENDEEIMYIDHTTDECIWFFNSDRLVTINLDDELYELLNNLMDNTYQFINNDLICFKDQNKLIWYSDCYYNPDDEWSMQSVSCITIERKDKCFEIKPSKKLDEKINRKNKIYGICFSPAGNGKYSKNINTGLTLQDDFVTLIYHKLLENKKELKKIIRK